MTSCLYIGIDPGKCGGIAVLGMEIPAQAWPMPETERDVFALLEEHCINSFALIEHVHSMPKQGVTSSFTFGRGYGFLRGCLTALGIPFEEVTPQVWQRALGCLSRGEKNITKSKAQQLFPALKITHAIADALLIAEHNRRTRKPVEAST